MISSSSLYSSQQYDRTQQRHTPHPYSPAEADIPGYESNKLPLINLLCTFAAASGALLLATRLLAKRINPLLSRQDGLIVMWFVLCESLGDKRSSAFEWLLEF